MGSCSLLTTYYPLKVPQLTILKTLWAVISWRHPLPSQIWAMRGKISLVGLGCTVRIEFVPPPPPPVSGDVFSPGEIIARSKSTVLPVLHLLQGALLCPPQAGITLIPTACWHQTAKGTFTLKEGA